MKAGSPTSTLTYGFGNSIAPLTFQAYLVKYGYAQTGPGDLTDLSDEAASAAAVRRFQHFFQLNLTGIMDNETVAAMQSPRCGMQDVHPPTEVARRTKRFILQGKSRV